MELGVTEKNEGSTELDIFKQYQENVAKTAQLQTEILKGIKEGKSIYNLFLLAAKGMSILTSNSAFYHQIEEDTAAIYGYGLGEPSVLQQQIEETEYRLSRLTKAMDEETNGDYRDRISYAVKAHKAELERLKAMQTSD